MPYTAFYTTKSLPCLMSLTFTFSQSVRTLYPCHFQDKPAKKAKKAKGKAKGKAKRKAKKATKATLTVKMPFKKKGAPVEVKAFPVKKGPIKYAEDYKLKKPLI